MPGQMDKAKGERHLSELTRYRREGLLLGLKQGISKVFNREKQLFAMNPGQDLNYHADKRLSDIL